MHLDNLLLRRQSDDCRAVCPAPPACACADNEECIQYNRDCNICARVTCVPKPSPKTNSSSGVSKGALAGGVIGALIFLAAAVGLFIWYRRSQRALKVPAEKKDVPASAADVLKRPDPTEKPAPQQSSAANTVRVYSISSNTTIDLDPESQNASRQSARGSTQSNPFTDTHSIQTVGTEGSQGTNVIPIALVSQESDMYSQTSSQSPARPVRSPELNLDHANVSNDSLRPTPRYAPSQISGISGVSSRLSYGSNASYSSDFLNEAPTIVTRQLMGVVKAEVINAPGSSARSSLTAKPSVRSPLAASSFGPADALIEGRESQVISLNGDPFGDHHASPNVSTATDRGSALPSNSSAISDWTPEGPTLPWNTGPSSRPSSISTQAASIADIGNATRVNVGLNGLSGGYAVATPQTATMPKSPYRTTMARLVTPNTSNTEAETLEVQQHYAIAHAQARAQAQGLENGRRVSGSSVMSAASRADSILESFPFVPPSPISDRPMRSPPASPLAKQVFSNANPKETGPVERPPTSSATPSLSSALSDELPAPPNRKTLGMSTGSQFSTASSGLGSFPFQIDSGNTEPPAPTNAGAVAAPSAFKGARHRASLDTLALTSDLSSYPLGFDRDSQDSYAAFASSNKA